MMGTKRWELFLPVYKRNSGGQIGRSEFIIK
jgi:hypothetical protein